MIKKSQWIMIWLLPLVIIGGLFSSLLGYVVSAMMVFLVILSIFKGRYWCWNLCPRGAFLDLAFTRFSLNRQLPRFFTKAWFRWLIFILFMCFLILRIFQTGGNIIMVGSVFVGMCILTTVIAIILAIFTKRRGWCAICPMGTLQESIYKRMKK